MSELKKRTNMLRNHRRRAKEFGQVIDYDEADLAALIDLAVGRPCPYCRRPVGLANVSVDHNNPVSRRGSFALANLSTMCEQCNQCKGSLTMEEWGALVEMAFAWHPDGWRDLMTRLRAGGGAWRNGIRRQ